MNVFDLTGHVAVVTGGSGGLGHAIAHGLKDMGAHVVVLDTKRPSCGDDDPGIRFIDCDITSDAAVQSVDDAIYTHWGPVDILVNNAGISIRQPLEELAFQEWQKVMAVNVSGTVRMCQILGRRMIAHHRGSIINITSTYALRAPFRVKSSAYAVSKAGIVGLTQSLASEWGEYNVRVNAIAPGHFMTAMTRSRMEDPDYHTAVIHRTPLKRIGDPDDIVGPVVFLASDASKFVTGHTLVVDGGWIMT